MHVSGEVVSMTSYLAGGLEWTSGQFSTERAPWEKETKRADKDLENAKAVARG